jgi:hypothetical protein
MWCGGQQVQQHTVTDWLGVSQGMWRHLWQVRSASCAPPVIQQAVQRLPLIGSKLLLLRLLGQIQRTEEKIAGQSAVVGAVPEAPWVAFSRIYGCLMAAAYSSGDSVRCLL